MDREMLQGIFDRVDIHRQRVVSRRELIATLADDENLHRLLSLPAEKVGQEVRRGFRSAFALGDDQADRFVTFDEFAAYLELSFEIASRAHDDPRPLLQPEPEPEPEPRTTAEKLYRENGAPPGWTGARFDEVRGADREPYAQPPSRAEYGDGPTSQSLDRSADGLAQHLAELEGRAAAAELTQRDAGSPGSNDLSREELEVQQQIAALEREHLERGDGT